MKISVLSKNEFNKLVTDSNITCDNVGNQNAYFISINDTEGGYSTSYFDGCGSNNVLVLRFDDTEEDKVYINGSGDVILNIKAMTEEQAKETVEFIKNMEVNDDTEIIIHCTAGQNRSASVGKFCVDFFEYDMDRFKLDNPRAQGNSTVSRLLNNEYLWGHYK